MPAALRRVETGPSKASVDASLLDELYRRYRPLVEGICARMFRSDHSLVQDLVQDVFIDAYRALPRFRTSDPMGPWLATIARRRCVDQLRRQHRIMQERPTGLDFDLPDADDPIRRVEDLLDARARLESLSPVLRLLTSRQRRVLVRIGVDGWSHQEVADELGIELVSARALAHRAREKIRAHVRVRSFEESRMMRFDDDLEPVGRVKAAKQ